MRYRIVGHTKCILKNGKYIRGTISVREKGLRSVHKVQYDYAPGGDYGWNQCGAPTEVLSMTVDAVEDLCSHTDY